MCKVSCICFFVTKFVCIRYDRIKCVSMRIFNVAAQVQVQYSFKQRVKKKRNNVQGRGESMQLVHRKDDIPKEQYKQMAEVERKIISLEKNIEAEEQEINNLKHDLEILRGEFKVTCLFVAVSALLAVRVFINPYGFFLNMISTLHIAILTFCGTILFIAYTVKRARKHFPMYIHCRQEEKGGSADVTNYVYQIKMHERRKAEYIKELEPLNQEYVNLKGE